jgi:ABC-2 type transport system ATP-binding protein
MGEIIVSVQGLRKHYGEVLAVKGISFEVGRGEVFALLGPNGSGKTSTLECLEGLRRPDGGSLSIAGVDPCRHSRKLRDIIGVQLQISALPPTMTVDEATRFFASYHGVAARDDLIERLGLAEKRRTQYINLSVGQQRRLAFIIAVAHEPRVLFLDEPTAGLDVQSRAYVHRLVDDIRQKGTTVILATHDMAEAEKLADRAAILLRGEIAAMGSPRQLTAAGNRMTRISVCTENGSLLAGTIVVPGVVAKGSNNGYALFQSEMPGKAVGTILDWIGSVGDTLVDLRVERPTLEERFLEITTEDPGKGAEA